MPPTPSGMALVTSNTYTYTSYAYTWFTGTTQMQSETVTAPVVSAAQNGPGTADVTTAVFDVYGRTIWTKDADGFIRYVAYDAATGAVVKTINYVNTADVSDFANLPTGWVTPSGGGLELITQYVVDALGRTTQEMSPGGNITYYVYLDTQYEVRVYNAFVNGAPTDPTEVFRDDRADGYTETFRMSAAPHLTNGAPDGTEAISGLQTLSRAYVDAAGQVVAADSYFNLSGLAYTTAVMGAVGVNFYQTQYAYDSRVQHLLRENGADAEANVFPFGQGDAPRQSGAAVEALSTRFLATPST
jgi:hypothetical protein